MVRLLSSYQLSLTGAGIQPRFLQGSHPDTCTDPPSKGSECERRAGHAVMLGVCQCWSRSWSWRLEPRQGVLNPGWGNPRVTCV